MGTSTLDVISSIATITALVAAVLTLATGLRSGVIRMLRFGPLEIQARPRRADLSAPPPQPDILEVATSELPAPTEVPFETEQAAQYYAQILAQSKVSFWFSLTFASLGFVVIIVAGFLAAQGETTATIAQFTSGAIIEAVSSLFFVQSRRAQQSMGAFFEKLRLDRQQIEARRLCDTIASDQVRDALRLQLALFYAGVPNCDEVAKHIMQSAKAGPMSLQSTASTPSTVAVQADGNVRVQPAG